jgi:CheY-like chemotaxis protein
MKKLLLVDDDAFLRDMYAIKFADSGYEVQIAETGHAAITIIKESPDLDVILLDMVMPGMSGIELISEIKDTFPDLDALCIVLSNQGEDSDVTAALNAGAAGYIVKAEAIPSDVVKEVANIMSAKK